LFIHRNEVCKQRQDSWGEVEHREQKLSSPSFVIQPARHKTSSDANTMTVQFDISRGRGV